SYVKKSSNRLGNRVALFSGQLGIDRQRERLRRAHFSLREIPSSMPEVGKTRLQGNRNRIINRGANFLLCQSRLESVSPIRFDDELMEVGDVPGFNRGQLNRNSGQTLLVGARIFVSFGVPFIQMRELGTKDG